MGIVTGKINVYEEAIRDYRRAEAWWNLRKEKDHGGGHFSMSPAHGKLMLMLCGQKSPGAQNYHESPKEFNDALLDIIKEEFEPLLDKVKIKMAARVAVAKKAALEEMEEAKNFMAEEIV